MELNSNFLFNPAGVGESTSPIPRALPWILELKASGFFPYCYIMKSVKAWELFDSSSGILFVG
jgi:hypothetical protein